MWHGTFNTMRYHINLEYTSGHDRVTFYELIASKWNQYPKSNTQEAANKVQNQSKP